MRSENQEPNYSSYSFKDLEIVYESINREKFPERFERLNAEIAKRRAEDPLGTTTENKTESIYPSSFRRLLAFAFDIVLISVLILPLRYLVNFFPKIEIPVVISQYLIVVVYFSFFDGKRSLKPSPGKSLLGIHILTTKGQKPSLLHSFLRSSFYPLLFAIIGLSIRPEEFYRVPLILYALSMIPAFGDTVFQFFHPQKRTLLDVLFRTFVLKRSAHQVDQAKNFSIKPTAIFAILFALILWLVDSTNNRIFNDPSHSRWVEEMKDNQETAKELKNSFGLEVVQVQRQAIKTGGISSTVFIDEVPEELFIEIEKRDQLINALSSTLVKKWGYLDLKSINFLLRPKNSLSASSIYRIKKDVSDIK